MKSIILSFILSFCLYQSSGAQWLGFNAPVTYHSTRNYYVLTKDINNDGNPDIITANVYTKNANSFGISVNDATGHFQEEKLVSIRAGYTVWDFADLNKDGFTDILTSYYWDNGIRVFTGTGLTTFNEGPLIATAVHGGISKIYDTDGDGNLDLISISQGSANPTRLHIFKGNGDGTFQPKVTFESPYTTARNLIVKDINQDNLPDIILAASYNKVPVFIQNVDHTFTAREIPVKHGESYDNAVGDINKDGIQDIVYAPGNFLTPGSTDTINIVLGTGNGNFKPPYTTTGLSSIQNPMHVRLADINKDMNPDIVTFDMFTKDIYYFLGNGDSTFAMPVRLTTNDTINDFEVTDVNLDNYPDIINVNKDSTFSVILNKGETTSTEDDVNNSRIKVYPNPFNDCVTIELSAPDIANAKINIWDVYGTKVEELRNGETINQIHQYQWHTNVPPGIYFLSITVNDRQKTYKLIKY